MSDVNKAEVSQLEDRIAGVTLTVIDTPGYLATEPRSKNRRGDDDPTAGKGTFLQEFARALVYARHGIDAILVTLKCAERVSMEERYLLELLTEMQVWKHCIILFTHGARVSKGRDECSAYMELCDMFNSGNLAMHSPILNAMIENCEKRFLIVESVENAGDRFYHRSKLDELYNAVETCRKARSPLNRLLNIARYWYFRVKGQKMDQMQLVGTTRDVAKGSHDKLDDAEQVVEDAVTLLLQYLPAPKEAADASPQHFVAALHQLEEDRMKEQETATAVKLSSDDIKSGNQRQLPDTKGHHESAVIPQQGDELQFSFATAPGDNRVKVLKKEFMQCISL